MLEKKVAKFDADEAKKLPSIKNHHPAAASPIVIQLPSEKFGHPEDKRGRRRRRA
jgi:hypothetical protein